MSRTWHRARAIAFCAVPAAPFDSDFPHAVEGEDYQRFARAVWAQGQRWLRKHAHQLARKSVAVDDVRDLLRARAMEEIRRALHPQEERLLGELWQAERGAIERGPGRFTPEIPAFLIEP